MPRVDHFLQFLLFLGNVLEPEAWNALFKELEEKNRTITEALEQ